MENNSQPPSSQPRPSGLPRPSRLPVPGQSRLPVPRSTSLRKSPSQESLPADSGPAGTSLQSPRLRSTTSRDQLTSTTTSRRPQSMLIAPSRVASSANCARAASRQGQSQVPPSTTRTTNRHSTYISPSSSRASVVASSVATSRTSQTPQTLASRRQSAYQPFSASTGSHALHDTESIVSDDSPTSAVRSNSTLIERTIETLSQLPSSPSVRGKSAASFYSDGIPKGRTSSRPTSRLSRPGSSHQSHESLGASSNHGSRPGSRLDSEDDGSSFHGTYGSLRPRQGVQSFNAPAARKATSRASRMSLYGDLPSSAIDNQSPKTPSTERTKPAAPRPLAKRTAVYGLSKKPSGAGLEKGTQGTAPRKVSMASQRSAATSFEGSVSASSGSTATSADSTESSPAQTYRKASSTLREQIAKAKAAAKKAAVQPISESAPAVGHKSSGFGSFGDDLGFASHHDPFNQHKNDQSQAKVLQARFATARTSGRLNMAAMGLKEIPIEVLEMYKLEAIGATGGAWAECVDLTRFVAADNELEIISDTIFPDVDPQEMVDDEDSEGNIFAGLETLDLHGNILVTLPMGFRQLRLLTSLNLSSNRLANSCLEVVSQITTLRDLKLGGNLLYGELDPCFANLENLEILDLHGNNLSSLPSNFGNLSRLRVLNVSENAFASLPFATLAKMPLTEINARKNQISGTLIDDSVDSLPYLQILDVSSNQLVRLCSPTKAITMPALLQICLSMNRLQDLPDIGSWAKLHTIAADENNINSVPEGFAKLKHLKSVDFSSNDIRIIPNEVGRMENLMMLRLSGNPLREKKFSTISTEEMKGILALRLEPREDTSASKVNSLLEVSSVSEVEVVSPSDAGLKGPDVKELTINTTETLPKTKKAPVGNNASKPKEAIVTNTATFEHDQLIDENDDIDDSRSDTDHYATPPTSARASPTHSRSQTLTEEIWPVKSGGVLDRSGTQSSSLHPVISSRVAAEHKVYEIQLHHNLFTAFPESLSFFAATLTHLNLSHNELVAEKYLGGLSGNDHLELRALRELNLNHNHISSLEPLLAHLRAPNLQKLDVSFNRISALPAGTALRDAFPNLVVLTISNNHLSELDPESIKGMHVVDAANNDIAHLNPRIGLLGGSGGLERLDVSGNRFRVPRWSVLERGTEATLRWLRGRVPVAEKAAWRGKEGGDEDSDLD
ncbi:uncharacterized protein B0T23DRAFT_146928 [Neurospora hispaniola]|uniref:Leucine-rich repeat-containing protein 40 n=1 Tax=Neurospora hispaniola TaxID=588809 RepID=A0AAJ0I874_9PEZI|nr:hypothetical protein B0T23DRAFT_146928 [Neurospora hispaniola]